MGGEGEKGERELREGVRKGWREGKGSKKGGKEKVGMMLLE